MLYMNRMTRTLVLPVVAAALLLSVGCEQQDHFAEKKAAMRGQWEQSRSTMVSQLAMEAYEHGELVQARERAIEALSMDRNNLTLRLLLVRIYLDEDNNEAALRHLKVMQQEDLRSWEVDYYTGVAYERMRDFDKALTWYDKAHDMAPTVNEPVQAAVEVLVQMNRIPEAQARLRGRINTNSPDAHLSELAGRLALRQDQHRDAARYFQLAHDADPKNLRYPEMLAMSHRNQGNYDQVINVLETHLNRPGYQPPSMVHLMLGESYLAQGKLGQATQNFEQAVAKHPDSAETWRALSSAYLAARNYRKAIEAGRKAEKIEPDNSETAMLLGYALMHNGDQAQAMYVLKNAYSRHPNDPLLLCMLGRVLHQQGNTSQAQQLLRRANQLDPNLQVASVMQQRLPR